jgi:hypothetical protein
MSTLSPPLKWHGGKHYLARRIIDLMPPHIHYVEPYGGYRSSLYDVELCSWSMHTFDLPNHAAGGSTKRRMTEVVWCNF